MTPSQAILAGSAVIAVSIFAAATVLPERGTPFEKEAKVTKTPVTAPTVASRYQIVKADDRMTWRLDTVTGEITVCRLEQDRMFCANSANAKTPPQMSADELRRQEAERRQAKRAERNEVLDKFMAFFERIIRFAEKQTDAPKPPPEDDERVKQL